MTTQTAVSSTSSSAVPVRGERFVRRVLYIDIASVTLAIALLILLSNPVAQFLGIQEQQVLGIDGSTFLLIFGVLLLPYAAFLVFAATRPLPQPIHVWLTVGGDILWVVGSAILLLSGVPALTQIGGWAVLLSADAVGTIGVLKFVGLRRMAKG